MKIKISEKQTYTLSNLLTEQSSVSGPFRCIVFKDMNLGGGDSRGVRRFKSHTFSYTFVKPQKDGSGNKIQCSGKPLDDNVTITVDFKKEATAANRWSREIIVQVEVIPEVCDGKKIKTGSLHYIWLNTSSFICGDGGELEIFTWGDPFLNLYDTKLKDYFTNDHPSGLDAVEELERMFGGTLPSKSWPRGMNLEALANKVRQIKYK